MRAVLAGMITAALVLGTSCSSVPKYQGKFLLEEHIPAWCFIMPPRSYTEPVADLNAPHERWLFQGCYPSWLGCEQRQESIRLQARKNVWFPPKQIGGISCGVCEHYSPFHYRLSLDQERELWLEQAEAGRCVSIDDPGLRNNDSFNSIFYEPPS